MIAHLKTLLDQPEPRTLQDWAWQAMLASFKLDASNASELWGGILQYIGWLDSLPVKR